MKPEWFLGIETSTRKGSMALVNRLSPEDGYIKEWDQNQSHSEWIIKYCDELFTKVGLSTNSLSGIVVGCGPGSFTGIRVAMNFARALAFANTLPIWTIDSLEAMAFASRNQAGDLILSGCEAFRNFIYVAQYIDEGRGLKKILNPISMTVEQLISHIDKPTTAVGNGLFQYWEELTPVHCLLHRGAITTPTALQMLNATVLLQTPPPPKDWKEAKPLYIRASEAEEKLKRGELKPQKLKF